MTIGPIRAGRELIFSTSTSISTRFSVNYAVKFGFWSVTPVFPLRKRSHLNASRPSNLFTGSTGRGKETSLGHNVSRVSDVPYLIAIGVRGIKPLEGV